MSDTESPAPAPTVEPQPDTGQIGSPPYFSILVVAALVVLAAGLQTVSSIAAPIFLVITLVITVAPLRRVLVKVGVPGPLASVVTLLAIYALLVLILGSVVWSIYRLVEKLPDYASAFSELLDQALALAERLGYGAEQIQSLADSLNLTSLAGPAQALLGALTDTGSLVLLIIAVVVFLTFDLAGIDERLEVIRTSRPRIADGLRNFAVRVRKYWVVTTVFGAIVAVLDVVALWIIGVPLALTWGVLAFVTNYIPNIGFVLGVIPPALIAVLDGGLSQAIWVVVVYTVINIVVQTLIQPRFTGDAVGISATVAFVSLIFWAFLLGGLGALLAIPATLFLKSMLLDNSVPASWLNALISSNPSAESPEATRERKREAKAERARRRAARTPATEPVGSVGSAGSAGGEGA